MSILITNETPVIIPPALAKAYGVPEAALLQQIHYMSNQEKLGIIHEGKKWVYNSLEQWHAKLNFLSEKTIERAISNLKKLGIIHVKQLSPNKSDRTNYYLIDYSKLSHIPELASPSQGQNPTDNLSECSPQNDGMHSPKLSICSPQNVGMDHPKMSETSPTKCRNGYTKNTKENSENTSKKKNATFENLEGTEKPTQPDPTPDQIAQTPKPHIELWRQLRIAKLDIAHDDPLLAEWIRHSQIKNVIQQLFNAKAVQSKPNHWHTPAQLGMVKRRVAA